MQNLKKYTKDLIYILILIIGIVLYVQHSNRLNDKFTQYENTISALNDSIHTTVKNGIKTYSKQTPEIDLTQLTNSEYFKTLSAQQQNYYKQLENIKGLISATNATLISQGELLNHISNNTNPGVISNDSIKFKLGTVLNFNQIDTSKFMQYKSQITLDKKIDFKFDYTYKINVQTNYVRQKDKSIVVTYNINDPNVKVTNMNNFIIPVESTKRTKLGKWIEKNRKPILLTTGAVLVGVGGYLGYILHP